VKAWELNYLLDKVTFAEMKNALLEAREGKRPFHPALTVPVSSINRDIGSVVA